MRTEFYRQRLKHLLEHKPDEARRLLALFEIENAEPIFERTTAIVPVNLTYFPLRARENLLSGLARRLVEDIPERLVEEIMTEGTMLLAGVDIDIRFGKPIHVSECLRCDPIQKDIVSARRFGFDDLLPSRLRMRKEALQLMQRYMKAIYDLTTINHDHISASMIRTLPGNRFKPYNLRSRIYHAADATRRNTGIWLHRNLQSDQLHLLTDDRYHHMQDFLAVAIEKGIIRKQNGNLIKDPSKFSSPYDFHRARIDNPVEVMANAVEPLRSLQRIVRKSAWMPAFWLKRSIASRLVRRAKDEFLQDYRRHFIEGESKPKDVGMPYTIRGRSRKIGVVLIHGYMAAPMEVRQLADYLGRKGLWVYAPRVKGHGTAPEDLADTTFQQWIDSVDIGYAIMRNTCRRVVVGGFSNGAGLALDLAARTQETAGVFAICPPMRLHDISTRLVPAVDVWNKLMTRVHLQEARMTFVENHPEFPEINYRRNPISGVRELERLMDAVRPRLAEITVPALVIQAQGDPVVHPKGSSRVFQALGCEDKSYQVLNFNRHGIVRGPGSVKVHRAVWNFIDRL